MGDGLVVPCTNVEDTAEAGARMLEALANRDEHSRRLAQNAVATISKRIPGKDPNIGRIVTGFASLVREVVTIPSDRALVSGVIHFDALNNDTKRAWLRAAAAVAKRLQTTAAMRLVRSQREVASGGVRLRVRT